METVEVDGLRVAYQRAGQGPPVVLLHGYVGDAATTWRRQLEELGDQFTVVAWDAPGAGGSSDPPESFGLAGYADCLAGFVGRLGLERPHVVGLSFGGALALELYRRHPEVPATLVLASATAGWGGSLPAAVASQRLRQALALSELSGEEFVGTLLPTMFSEGTAPEAVEAFGASMLELPPGRVPGHGPGVGRERPRGAGRIEVPTLLVYGDDDVRAPMAVAEDLHASISRVDAGRPAGRRARRQHRSPRRVQPGGPKLPPRPAQVTDASCPDSAGSARHVIVIDLRHGDSSRYGMFPKPRCTP